MEKITIAQIDPGFTEAISQAANHPNAQDGFYINVLGPQDRVNDFNFTVSGNPVSFECNNHPESVFEVKKNGLYRATLDGQSYTFKTASEKGTMGDTSFNLKTIDVIESDGAKYVTGDSDGSVEVYDVTHTSIQSFANIHDSYITSTRFFPSGKVVLSASSDMRLKVLSVEDGSNPRTLVGHRSAISGTAIIGRGRNVLSSSSDGTIRLWECGSGTNIHTFTRRENAADPVSSMFLIPNDDSNVSNPVQGHDNEYGTEGNIVLGAYDSGVAVAFDVFNKNQIMQLPNEFLSSCTAVSADSTDPNYIYTGYADGTVAQWDMRSPDASLEKIMVGEYMAISDIKHIEDKLAISANWEVNLLVGVDNVTRKIDTQNPDILVSDDHFLSIAHYCDRNGVPKLIGVGDDSVFYEYSLQF